MWNKKCTVSMLVPIPVAAIICFGDSCTLHERGILSLHVCGAGGFESLLYIITVSVCVCVCVTSV